MANSEYKPTKNGWFKNFLFSMKKNHSRKRVNCNCPCTNSLSTKKDQPTQTSVSVDNKEENIQKRGLYFGKGTKNQKGCGGLHIYFCINSNGKVKNARCKGVRKDKTKKGANSIICDTRSVKSLPWSHSTRSQSPKNIKTTTNNNVSPREVVSEAISSPTDKPSENSFKSKEIYTKAGGSILRIKTSSHVLSDSIKEPNTGHGTSVHLSTQEKMAYYLETDRNKNEAFKTSGEADVDEEAVFKEYEALQQQNRLKRKSMKNNRATLVRNSLISIRKKRQSYTENLIPEIFSKLDEIEEKLHSLEKVYDVKGNNITNIVGISCKSMGSFDLANLDKVDDKDKKKSSVSSIPCNTYKIHPVLIKPVVANTSVNLEEFSIVKKMRSEPGSSKHLVYYKTLLLDAHNISSKSTTKSGTVDRPAQKSAAWYGAPGNNMVKKHLSPSWRRISEELKL